MDEIHKKLVMVAVAITVIFAVGIMVGKQISKPAIPKLNSKDDTIKAEKDSEQPAAGAKSATEIKETPNN